MKSAQTEKEKKIHANVKLTIDFREKLWYDNNRCFVSIEVIGR